MFDTISCYVSGDKIEVNGQTFLLGELSEDMLNISRDEFLKMNTLCEKLEELRDKPYPSSRLFEIRAEMGLLRPMFMKRKLFQTLVANPSPPEIDVSVFLDETLDEEEEDTEQTESSYYFDDDNKILDTATKYMEIVHDIFAFNNTMFNFIDRLKWLEKLDAEHYATAFYEFLRDPITIDMFYTPSREERIFLTRDPLTVEYVPREVPDKPGSHAIYECYYIKRLQSFLKLDFHRALMAGHIIRRCKNCKQFFLLTKGFHTEYCDRPIPGRPHRNCRNQGAKNIAKEKAQNNPVIQYYELAYQRVSADYRRGRITMDQRAAARRRLVDLRDEAISGRYRDAEVKRLMQPEPLYGALNIVRQGGR